MKYSRNLAPIAVGRIVWVADGGPSGQLGKSGPGWGGQTDEGGIPGGQRDGHPHHFERPSRQSHGLAAYG